MISNAYHNIQSIVSINTYQSPPFDIQRGIRQGGGLSALFYIVFINDLVEELDKSNLGVSICDIKASNPTLVDDLTLVSRSPLHLQLMINIGADNAKRWKFYTLRRHGATSMATLCHSSKQVKNGGQ